MDELKEIIVHKLRFIAEYKQKIDKNQNSNLCSEELLKEKKKQNSREVIQSRLLQSLIIRKIDAPYRVQEFYNNSKYMMQIYDSAFEHDSNETDLHANIVSLYVKFFEKQNCDKRAQEVNHIYKKKLCEKSFLVPTIFNWFAEWVRKVFNSFIKNALVQLNESAAKNRLVQKKIRKMKADNNQIANHQASIKKIHEELKINKASSPLIIRKSQLIDFCEGDDRFASNILGRNILRSPRVANRSQLEKSRQKQLKQKQVKQKESKEKQAKEKHDQKTGRDGKVRENKAHSVMQIHHSSSLASNLSAPFNIVSKQKQQISYIGINKQVFCASFSDEVNSLYKYYSTILTDLDLAYLKSYRRAYKREQIKNRLNDVAKALSRGQPEIKKSIEDYSQQYYLKFAKKKKNEEPVKQSPLKNDRSKSKLIKKLLPRIINEEKNNEERVIEVIATSKQQQLRTKVSPNSFLSSQARNRQSKSLNARASESEKPVILQLPEIKVPIKNNVSGNRPSIKIKKLLLAHTDPHSGRYLNSQLHDDYMNYREEHILPSHYRNNSQLVTSKQRLSTELASQIKYQVSSKKINLSLNQYHQLQQDMMIFKSKNLYVSQNKKRKETHRKSIKQLNKKSVQNNLKDMEIEKEKLLFKKYTSGIKEQFEGDLDDPDGVFYLPKIRT